MVREKTDVLKRADDWRSRREIDSVLQKRVERACMSPANRACPARIEKTNPVADIEHESIDRLKVVVELGQLRLNLLHLAHGFQVGELEREKSEVDDITAALEATTAKLVGLSEEHGAEGGALDLDPLNRPEVSARLKDVAADKESRDEATVLKSWLDLNAEEADLKKRQKSADADLNATAYAKYPQLTDSEIKQLVVEDKWLAMLDQVVHGEMDDVSQQLAQRVRVLAERYETPLPQMAKTVAELEAKVNRHLQKMGFSWK